jgi:PelA/Pel-15E family pectate lyase
MIRFKITCFPIFFFYVITSFGQEVTLSNGKDYLRQSWKNVATEMPDDWYASPEAKLVAENVMFCQQDIGGWAKNKPYHHPLTKKDSIEITRLKANIGATIDNGATITEMRFLARVYAKHKDERYKASFEKGMNYLVLAQYPNGGWPQFYPLRKGTSVSYAAHITYNDNAMVNVMKLLRDIYEDNPVFKPLGISAPLKEKTKHAFDKGIDCILRSQIKVNGQPTVWCAQHDEVTLAPANARAYELASFSGSESAGITLLLMDIKNPSPLVTEAITGAVKWFEANQLKGIKVEKIKGADGRENTMVVKDPHAPSIWARFYDLKTNRPFFCDRDGVKKYSLAKIGAERRNGYSWYTYSPAQVLKRFESWDKTTGGSKAKP